jgi:hypothetical protein
MQCIDLNAVFVAGADTSFPPSAGAMNPNRHSADH